LNVGHAGHPLAACLRARSAPGRSWADFFLRW
jgi:hypothetical protein